MDYIPPPKPQSEIVILAAHKTQSREERLIIYIDEAQYDKDGERATIKMSKALQKSHVIQSYNGKDITLVYNDAKVDFTACPSLRVPTKDIKRDISFIDNTVTLTISNIPIDLAEKISEALCLLIDTETVKKVSNPNYPPPNQSDPKKPYKHLNP